MRHVLRPRGRPALRYSLFSLFLVAALTILYELRLYGLAAHERLSLDDAQGFGGPAGEDSGVYPLDGTDLANIPKWRGRAGGDQPSKKPTQPQKLAVLLPCWADCSQASILVLYLSSLLTQQGIPFRIHVLEQTGDAPFNPGLLVDIGFKLAVKADGSFVADYIAYQQAGLVPLVNVSYAYPSTPFLHLATEQSIFNNVLPYESYCGGAWLARTNYFGELGGMSTAYAGFEGLEDDLCRRVVELGPGELPRVPPGHGRFTATESSVLQELATIHRGRNREAFMTRWGPNASMSAVERRRDGLAGLPPNWPQLVTVMQQSDTHGWWRAQLPNTGASS